MNRDMRIRCFLFRLRYPVYCTGQIATIFGDKQEITVLQLVVV